MKQKFFVDLYPHHLKDPTGMWVRPITKVGEENKLPHAGSKRIVFTLEVPDDLFVDHYAATEIIEIVNGESERENTDQAGHIEGGS